MALEHEKITEQIIGAAFEVHGILGYGVLEKVYQRARQVDLKRLNLKDLPIQENPRLIRVHPRPKQIAHNQTLEVTLNSAPEFIVVISFRRRRCRIR